MSPTSSDGWLDVARERASDADALLGARDQSAGSVYFAGYAIECSLKALLQRSGKAFPTAGGAGHDLRGLWLQSGFRLGDISDASGAKTFFVESWSTDLRYEVAPSLPGSTSELVGDARQLSSWIQTQIRRQRPPRR
jgi:hypothetical protein